VENSIAPGKFNTTVEALFVYSGDGNNKVDRGGKTSVQQKPKNLLKVNSVKDSCDKITFLRGENFRRGISDSEKNYGDMSSTRLDKEIDKLK
jgi:hypothetical protein